MRGPTINDNYERYITAVINNLRRFNNDDDDGAWHAHNGPNGATLIHNDNCADDDDLYVYPVSHNLHGPAVHYGPRHPKRRADR